MVGWGNLDIFRRKVMRFPDFPVGCLEFWVFCLLLVEPSPVCEREENRKDSSGQLK